MQKTSNIEFVLAQTRIFHKIEAIELKKIINTGLEKHYEVGDLIYDSNKLGNSIPLIVVLEGCVAVIESTDADDKNDIFDALVMPYQILGEFQLLGYPFPQELKLIAFEKTKTFEINRGFLGKLPEKDKIQFYRNLAKTLVEKINIGNLQLYIRDFGRASAKFPEYLRQVLSNEIWSRVTEKKGRKYNLNIFWTVAKLSRYLSLDEPSLTGILKKFVEVKVGEIVWYDKDFNPIERVTLDDIEHLNAREGKLKRRTKFKIMNLDKRKIGMLEGLGDKKAKDY
jgi:hypothetical protein